MCFTANSRHSLVEDIRDDQEQVETMRKLEKAHSHDLLVIRRRISGCRFKLCNVLTVSWPFVRDPKLRMGRSGLERFLRRHLFLVTFIQ